MQWEPDLGAPVFNRPVPASFGQVVYDGNNNLPPFGSFHGGDFDVVALQNGNLHIEIPFAKVPRRGGSFTYRFVYDTPTFELNTFRPTPTSSFQGLVSLSSDTTGWRVPRPDVWETPRFVVTDHTCTIITFAGTESYGYQIRSSPTPPPPKPPAPKPACT